MSVVVETVSLVCGRREEALPLIPYPAAGGSRLFAKTEQY